MVGVTLEQAKRIYKTWKHHPDMLVEADQVVEVVEVFVKAFDEYISELEDKIYEEKKK